MNIPLNVKKKNKNNKKTGFPKIKLLQKIQRKEHFNL